MAELNEEDAALAGDESPTYERMLELEELESLQEELLEGTLDTAEGADRLEERGFPGVDQLRARIAQLHADLDVIDRDEPN